MAAPKKMVKMVDTMPAGMMVPKGFLPSLVYAGAFAVAPLIYEYVDINYTDSGNRSVAIILAALYALLVLAANDCSAWFNMVTFFHIGVEIRVLDKLMSYAQRDGLSDMNQVWAWIGFAVILAHLIPFLLIDQTKTLAILATTGVIVNAAVNVHINEEDLLYVGFSSVVLLGTTLCVRGICNVKCSILTSLNRAIYEGTWIVCSTYR